jgi:hypothetical protein
MKDVNENKVSSEKKPYDCLIVKDEIEELRK